MYRNEARKPMECAVGPSHLQISAPPQLELKQPDE